LVNVTDQELANQLLELVAPGDDVLGGLANTSDAIAAVIDLVEMAAIDRIALPRELLDAVRDMADEGGGGMDDDDIAALREDLTTLSPLALPA
jgi:hypothetical protein